MMNKKQLKNFIEKIRINEKTNCWEWRTNPDKEFIYPTFRMGDKLFKAHRISYKFWNRDPNNKSVCHACDNPRCVNPDHLFLATHKENMEDMVAKNRSTRGESNANSKLTREEAEEIKSLLKETDLTQREIAKKYNISQTTVSGINRNKLWFN